MAGINDFAALMPMFMQQWQAQQKGQNTGNPLPEQPPPTGSVPELMPPKPAGIAPQVAGASGAAPGTMAGGSGGSGIMDWLNGNTSQGFNRGMMLQGMLAGIGAARPGTDPMSMFTNMAQGAAAGGMQGVQNGWAAANQQQQHDLAAQKGQLAQQQIDTNAMNTEGLKQAIAQLQKAANPADPNSAKNVSDLLLKYGNIFGPHMAQGVQPATPKGMR